MALPRDRGAQKVLVVFGSLERAGAQLQTLERCRELRKRFPIHFDFCVLGLGPIELDSEVEAIGASVYVVPLRSRRFVSQFFSLLRRERYDVVFSVPKLLSGIVLWLADRADVPVRIASFENTLGDSGRLSSGSRIGRIVLPSRVFARLMRNLISRHATHVVAVSRNALDTMLPAWRQARSSCQVIYNGVDLSRFQQPADVRGVREEFGWPSESRVVVSVARFSPQKNHRTVLEATRLAYQQDERVRLLLVGSGRLQDEVNRRIDAFGMREICAVASKRTDVPRLLLASDVFLFPSLWEGLPLAPLEALAAGLPVVASDIPPIQELAEYFPGSILMSPPNAARKHADNINVAFGLRGDRAAAQARFTTSPFTLEKSVDAHAALYGLPHGAT